MKKGFIILTSFLGIIGLTASNQPLRSQAGSLLAMAEETRTTKLAPTVLQFDRMLVYEQIDYNGSVVRYQVLLNSQTGQFGFDKKLASLSMPGFTDNFKFATGEPDGSYRIFMADRNEGKVIIRYNAARSYYAPNRASACRARLEKRYHATGREGSQYGLTATEYRASLGRRDTEWMWVAEVPFNSYPLYLFNELALEAKLPDAHSINFSSALGPNELLVQSKKEYYSELVNGKPATSTLRLIFFGPAKHTFDATGYRMR